MTDEEKPATTQGAGLATADVDAERPLLPLMLDTLKHRDLTREDFPDGGAPLPAREQLQLIERALELGRLRCAHLMAVAIGCPWRFTGGRVEWGLRRWLKSMQTVLP